MFLVKPIWSGGTSWASYFTVLHDLALLTQEDRGDYKRGFEQPQRRTSDLIKVGAQPKIVNGTLGPGTTHIEATSGNVSVGLVGNSAVNVSTQTVTGNVENDFVNPHDSTSPNLDIQTVNGNITVTKG
jgi:hypothetical protein